MGKRLLTVAVSTIAGAVIAIGSVSAYSYAHAGAKSPTQQVYALQQACVISGGTYNAAAGPNSFICKRAAAANPTAQTSPQPSALPTPIAHQATLPAKSQNQDWLIRNMEVRSSGYTVPWAMWEDNARRLWLNPDYNLTTGQLGTSHMLVERTANGYKVTITAGDSEETYSPEAPPELRGAERRVDPGGQADRQVTDGRCAHRRTSDQHENLRAGRRFSCC